MKEQEIEFTRDNLKIQEDSHYPKWIKDSIYSGNQTSGIAFIGSVQEGSKSFLIADDVGEIYRLEIKRDSQLVLKPVSLSLNVQTYLDSFPKKDFEEIVFDKKTNNVYLSIEGNKPNPQNFVGIYKIYFKDNDVRSDSIVQIEKLAISPDDLFKKYISNNIGYEGLAEDKKYFYLGLEGFSEKGVFSDSTIILIVNKDDLKIVKQISTKPFGIFTICGLYSDSIYSLYGIDRNNKSLFHLNFDDKLDIVSFAITKIETNIPNFPSIDYVASLEGITMDDQKNIFLVDDPWKQFFVPSKEILSNLDNSTVDNFKNYIPIIYKYKISGKHDTALQGK